VIIDFHTHIVPVRVKQDRQRYANADRGFAAVFSDPKVKLATADDLIAAMDRDGIDISVVLNYGWFTQALCVEINDYILESVARFPKRLIGFCTVAPGDRDAALKELERCAQSGAKGVGEIRPDTLPVKSRIRLLKPVLDFMTAHGLILLTHVSEPVGHRYPGKGTATPGIIMDIVTAFPDLKIVCAHWGGGLPFYALMPEVKQALKNVYFDTAASPYLYDSRIYRQTAELVGVDKILFGSDYPLIRQKRYLKEVDALNLPEKTERAIFSGNARRLFGLKGSR
jgi:hypothetical protein